MAAALVGCGSATDSESGGGKILASLGNGTVFREVNLSKLPPPKGYISEEFVYQLSSYTDGEKMHEIWAIRCADSRYEPILIEKLDKNNKRLEGGPMEFFEGDLQKAEPDEVSGKIVSAACADMAN